MLSAIIQILGILIEVFTTIVIISFIFSLLLTFNVISLQNNIVAAIWQSINAILDPFLKPIRRIMPDTGMIDLSPMVLILGLYVVQILLAGLARSIAQGTLLA